MPPEEQHSTEEIPALTSTELRRTEKHERAFEVHETATERMTLAAATTDKGTIEYGAPEPNGDHYASYPDQDMAIVADGAGGYAAPDVASKLACDAWPEALNASREEVGRMTREAQAALWEEVMIEGAATIIPSIIDEAELSDKKENRKSAELYIAARNRVLEEARAEVASLDVPREVQQEAVALARGLQDVSRIILDAATQDKTRKGMTTTLTGYRVMDASDGRRFLISFGVGDSEQLVAEDDANGMQVIEEAVPTDSGLAMMVEAGMIDPREAQDPSAVTRDPLLRKMRFQMVTQVLGQEWPVIPHIKIREVKPGSRARVLLTSDGVTDNDTLGSYRQDLTDDARPLSARVESMMERSIAGTKNPEHKGPDDTTAVIAEIFAPVDRGMLEARVVTMLREELLAFGAEPAEAVQIEQALTNPAMTKNIVVWALREAAMRQQYTMAALDTFLRDQVRSRIALIASPQLHNRIEASVSLEQESDMAAE